MGNAKVIAIANQKGGVGKTNAALNLGIGLVRKGKKVLAIDADPQSDLTTCLGFDGDELDFTLSELVEKSINDEKIDAHEGILKHEEGIDLLPSNIDLSAVEMALMNAMSREFALQSCIDVFRPYYDYIIIDCMPSLGMLVINCLAAADSVIIPVQAHYLPTRGMAGLLKTIVKLQHKINPELKIDGIVFTLVDSRTKLAQSAMNSVREVYEGHINIFKTEIPVSVKAAETGMIGKSIFAYDKYSTVAFAYEKLTDEVINLG